MERAWTRKGDRLKGGEKRFEGRDTVAGSETDPGRLESRASRSKIPGRATRRLVKMFVGVWGAGRPR